MKTILRFAAIGCLLLSAISAAALDCARAATPIEKTICREPDLAKSDTELNQLYSTLRPEVSTKARPELLAQQRAWLAERNRECATGEAACLRKQYAVRLDQLRALNATAESLGEPLNDVTPIVVKGTWMAAGIQDPTGKTDDAVLRTSLSSANLPAVGGSVNASAGKFCVPPQPCDDMGWIRRPLSGADAGRAIGRYLGLSPTTPVLIGSSGATRSYYLLVPRSDGSLWAVFTMCGPNGTDCRKAAERWTPASADAGFWPK
ncbi:MAG TPA: lysozyme inhibitor LprI family protein [Acidobacteriaceae bacterium]|jgi:uncharacterized protein